MNEECELCRLDRINHVFYNCDDFIIIPCDSCNVPMVVPYEHIDPTKPAMFTSKKRGERIDLLRRMESELTKVAYEFYDDLGFFIDKHENKIPNHMHWHARKVKSIGGHSRGHALIKIRRKNAYKLKGVKR